MSELVGSLAAGEAVLHETIDAVEAEWEELADELDASPFARPGWLACWWSAFGRGSLGVLAVRRGGQLVAVLPLQRLDGAVRSATNWHSVDSGLLAADSDAARRLGHALFERAPRSAFLAFLDPAVPGLAECEEAAHAARYRVIRRPMGSSPVIAIKEDWLSFEQRLSRNLRADVGRRLRRLEESGDVELRVADWTEGLDALLEEGFRLEALGWKGERGTAIASQPETRAFYEGLARWAAARGWLRLAFLCLDGAPIAFQLNLVAANVHYHLKGGYDPAFERFSPGKVLHRLLIEQAFRSGVRRYEFLGAAEQYKLQWANDSRMPMVLHAFRGSPRGTAEWLAYAYGRPVAKRVVARLRRTRRALGRRH